MSVIIGYYSNYKCLNSPWRTSSVTSIFVTFNYPWQIFTHDNFCCFNPWRFFPQKITIEAIPKKVSISTNTAQNFMGGRFFFSPDILMISSDGLRHLRCWQKTFVASTRVTYLHHWPVGDVLSGAPCSLRTRLPTLQPSSRDWRVDIDRAHAELYLSWGKTQFRIDTATQACTWTTLRLPLHVHVLYVHAFMQKVFCGGMKKFAVGPSKCSRSG